MVTLGWIIGRPLGLLFDPFESVVSVVSPMIHMKLSCLLGALHRWSVIFSSISCRKSERWLVQTMSYVVADGKSNWLEGIILISESNS